MKSLNMGIKLTCEFHTPHSERCHSRGKLTMEATYEHVM